jgi:hypothetical protein
VSLDLEAIKARAEAATDGPWSREFHHDENAIIAILPPLPKRKRARKIIIGRESYGYDDPGLFPGDDDVEFIAHARQDVPDLLAEIERLRDIVATLIEAE